MSINWDDLERWGKAGSNVHEDSHGSWVKDRHNRDNDNWES